MYYGKAQLPKHKTQNANGCIDETDGSMHRIGESWNATNCRECFCDNDGYRCCDRFVTPRHFPEDCVAVFDLETCVYRVHLKDDPSIECHSFGGVGK
ncbi:beta-microseminoprotein-like [Rhinoraja longicauda]